MSHEQEKQILDKIAELFAQHKESNTVVTSQFIKEVKDSQIRNEVLFEDIKLEIKHLKERTENTPLVNKAVFTVVGFICVGFFATIGAFVWGKLSALFTVVPK